MSTNYEENNRLTLVGKVTSDKVFSHEIYGEKFYIFDLEVPRLSGNADIIPITISERLLTENGLPIGSKISVEGQFRSYNCYQGEKNRLILTVFAKQVDFVENQEEDIQVGKDITTNEVVLDGYICKKPIYRKTPFGREIADILLAVNRAYGKSDYIPCICWGRNARYAGNLSVGSRIQLWGRIQSREYQKRVGENNVVSKVAYEISVNKMEYIDDGINLERKVADSGNIG